MIRLDRLRHIFIRVVHLASKIMLRCLFSFFSVLFSLLPLKVSFFFVAVSRGISFRVSHFLARAFMLTAEKRLKNFSDYQFSSYTRAFPLCTASTLISLGAFQESIDVLEASNLIPRSADAVMLMSTAYFEMAEFQKSSDVLDLYPSILRTRSDMVYHRGLMELLKNREENAIPHLIGATNCLLNGWCPHQNIAARYPSKYNSCATDWQSGIKGLLFDAYNFLGQRVTHVGLGHLGPDLYAKALDMQSRLMSMPVNLSENLRKWLLEQDITFDNLRIIPWEWTTQIGHIGMLDILFRMRQLGWWSQKAIIILPPGEKIANKTIISLFKNQALILASGHNIDGALMDELFSLQRYVGLGFNAWKFPDGEVVPWQQAGARLMCQWEAEGRDLPLRVAFDSLYNKSSAFDDYITRTRREWGMKPGDWYVCLHMRDAGFYGEMAGFGQDHRNSKIESYFDAIEYITSKGGWVIKLGGKQSPNLPKMPRVIDYARSSLKSELLDIYLIRNARFFIGTTSGLTNIAVSFGIPCALVNCITTDAQLWNSKVRFALKQITTSEGNILTQHEVTTRPWRWRMFGAEVLRRHHAIVQDNSSDEILEVVKEIDSLANGTIAEYNNCFPRADKLIAKWKNSLAFSEYYGAALPSIYYLQKHENTFLRPLSLVDIENKYSVVLEAT